MHLQHYVELFVEAGFVEVRTETRTVSLLTPSRPPTDPLCKC
jgi:hypothetical protein